MTEAMQITSFGFQNDSASLRKEAADTRRAIENAPPTETYTAGDERQLAREQGELWRGEVRPDGMSAVKLRKGSTVVLNEKIVKEDNRAIQVAAAIAGTLVGAALFGGKKKGGSLGGALASLVLGGLAAWGAGKATDVVKERQIERTETNSEGVSRERWTEDRNGENYTQHFKRTAPPKPVDPAELKDYLDKLEI